MTVKAPTVEQVQVAVHDLIGRGIVEVIDTPDTTDDPAMKQITIRVPSKMVGKLSEKLKIKFNFDSRIIVKAMSFWELISTWSVIFKVIKVIK